MAHDPRLEEWLRLPGLFRWSEVCDLFWDAASEDDWRFVVRVHSVTPEHEHLYTVELAPPGASPARARPIRRARSSQRI